MSRPEFIDKCIECGKKIHNADCRFFLCSECREKEKKIPLDTKSIFIAEAIKELQRDVEDYVDNLRKSNDMFRKSQDELADMILDRIQKYKLKYLEGKDV